MGGWTAKKLRNGQVRFRKQYRNNANKEKYKMESYLYQFISNNINLRNRQIITPTTSTQMLTQTPPLNVPPPIIMTPTRMQRISHPHPRVVHEVISFPLPPPQFPPLHFYGRNFSANHQ